MTTINKLDVIGLIFLGLIKENIKLSKENFSVFFIKKQISSRASNIFHYSKWGGSYARRIKINDFYIINYIKMHNHKRYFITKVNNKDIISFLIYITKVKILTENIYEI